MENLDEKAREKERGRSRRAATKQLLLELDDLCDSLDRGKDGNKRPRDRRGALGSGRTVPELLAKAFDVVSQVKKEREEESKEPSRQGAKEFKLEESPGSSSPVPGGAAPSDDVSPDTSAPCGPGLKPSDCRIEDDIISQGLLEGTGVGTFSVTFPDCRIQAWSKMMDENWQPASVMIGQPIGMIVHPEDFRVLKVIASKSAESCKSGYVEVEVNTTIRMMYMNRTGSDNRPVYSFSPVWIGTVPCVRDAKGSALAVFVVSPPKEELQAPIPWSNYLTPELCWKISGVYQFDGTHSKDSPIDVLFELRKNKISVSSALSQEASGLADRVNSILSTWIKGCCRSVANPVLQLLRFHIQLEYRENAAPWCRVHSSIAWHSKWSLVISMPVDASFFSSIPLKMDDGWEHTVNATVIQGISDSVLSFVSQEWRVKGSAGCLIFFMLHLGLGPSCVSMIGSARWDKCRPKTELNGWAGVDELNMNLRPDQGRDEGGASIKKEESEERQRPREVVAQRIISFSESSPGVVHKVNFNVLVGGTEKTERRLVQLLPQFHFSLSVTSTGKEFKLDSGSEQRVQGSFKFYGVEVWDLVLQAVLCRV